MRGRGSVPGGTRKITLEPRGARAVSRRFDCSTIRQKRIDDTFMESELHDTSKPSASLFIRENKASNPAHEERYRHRCPTSRSGGARLTFSRLSSLG
jgi:hypothetical protein